MKREESERGKAIKLTSWEDLDASVTCLFDLYMARLDPFERYTRCFCYLVLEDIELNYEITTILRIMIVYNLQTWIEWEKFDRSL